MVLFLTISWLAKRAKLADLKMLLAEGEKITPKAWRVEREQLEKEVPTLLNGRARVCHDLAYAEVIRYNKANLECVEQNESRQKNRQKSRTKRGRRNCDYGRNSWIGLLYFMCIPFVCNGAL